MAKRRTKVVIKAKRSRASKNQELTRLGAALRGLGGIGGGALGSLVGQGGMGSSLGTQLGAGISRWLGSGDYSVSTNSVLDRASPTGAIPSMHKSDQTIVVRHKEFIGEIRGSIEYTVQNILNINPGLPQTFPWLSTVAAKFQEYKIKGMVFHYVPSSGTAISSTSAALGTVMFQTSYRAGESPPSNKQELLNEYWSTEARPCDPLCHPIECDPKENPYNLHYVRSGSLPSGQDQLLYDLGSTYVATSGMQADGQLLGDMWVTYEVELKKPVMVSSIADVNKAYAGNFTTNVSALNPFGDVITLGNGNLGLTFSSNTMTIPKHLTGFFYVAFDMRATTTYSAVGTPSTFAMTNCIPAASQEGSNNISNSLLGGGGTLTSFFIRFAFYKPDTNAAATVTFNGITTTGTTTRSNILVFNRASPLW